MECQEQCANPETGHFDFLKLTRAYQELAFMRRRESTRRAHIIEKVFSSNTSRLLWLVLLIRRRLWSQTGSKGNPVRHLLLEMERDVRAEEDI